MKRKEVDEPISTELAETEDPILEAYRTTIKDVRYILNQYRMAYPKEAWETITKLVYDKKLK